MRAVTMMPLLMPAVFVAGCQQPEPTTPAPAARENADLPSGRDDHTAPRPDNLAEIMQAKLVHTQAIVEGLALGDLSQVEGHAAELIAISERAEWKVVDTVTYVAMSDMFRDVAGDLARRAADGDADAALSQFTRLTNTCVSCHSYLRREQLYKDLPGSVSWIGGGHGAGERAAARAE